MKPVSVLDFLKYRYLTGLALSPDETFVSFVVTIPDESRNSYNHGIWVVDTFSGEQRSLTACDDAKICVWEDNSHIIFSAEPNDASRQNMAEGGEWTWLCRYDVVNGKAEEICKLPYRIQRLIKIRGTTYAAVVRYQDGISGLSELPEKERQEKLKKIVADKDYEVFEELPQWFNGKGTISGVRERLFLLEISTGKMNPLTDKNTQVEQVSATPKGELLFTTNTYQGMKKAANGLWCYHMDGREPECLIEQNKYMIQYAGYVKGHLLMFATDMKRYGFTENCFVYEVTDGNYRLLLQNEMSTRNSIDSDCRMGSDSCFGIKGDTIYFLATIENHTSISSYTLGADRIERFYEGMGAIDEFVVCSRGFYFSGLQDDRLSEVYVLENQRAVPLTSVNRDLMEKTQTARTEWITFSYKGVELQGAVIFPTNFNPERTYPGILTIHGGPKDTYGQVFYHELQLWAANGYFVFFTNPMGSDGRDNVFADIAGKQGMEDYEQLMAFTDTVMERYPYIDSEHLGVTGHSYGGFMTNWIIGHTNRFACAVAMCSISNWISKVMTTDVGYLFNTDQLHATPWSDIQKLWFHSPLAYADQVQTPTLFVHGKEDYRCCFCEPVQMFQALCYHQVEARLLLVGGENHWMARGIPRHRIRRLEEILNWFDRFLKS